MCWSGCAGVKRRFRPQAYLVSLEKRSKSNPEDDIFAAPLTAMADARFMAENLPACGPIPLL
jgi:hypothetical protein